MPASGVKRVKGVSVYRPFAMPLPADRSQRPANIPPDHTHRWTVYVRGVDGADITYWLKKVQFKLHETYSQTLHTKEAPEAFEVTETGWGEFEVGIKLAFVPESGEKPASVYHQLKLHPYGDDKEAAKERGDSVVSQNYEEVVFNEPSESFYEILTNPHPPAKGKSKSSKLKKQVERTAEIPEKESASNPYSNQTEFKELDRIKEAIKQVETMVDEEKEKLGEREKELDELRKSEGVPVKTK